MDRPTKTSRRQFLLQSASAAAVASLAVSATSRTASAAPLVGDPWRGLKVGMATYSFIQFDRDYAIKATNRVGVKYCSIKDKHMPRNSTAAERKAAADAFRNAGITPLSCGNVGMNDKEADIRSAFEYARDAGIPVIVCSPTRASLPILDKCVKEFDIKLAIHNHGPEDKVWPSPYDPWKAIQDYDPRIGLCIDVGHTSRAGVDPAEAINKCAARLYDVHLKDLADNSPKSKVIEVGRGILDIQGILAALRAINFQGHVGLEYEKDMKDPMPGIGESIGFIRGLLSHHS